MVRRVIEEDVAAPSTTVVEDDGSWIGRTIVTLVVLALLVAGAIWLVRAVSDSDTGVGDGRDTTNNEVNIGDNEGGDTGSDTGTDTNTDTNTDTSTSAP
ncbi:MAG TPA: hypothetical protein VNA20_11480 [Frankiaceae bacterium]|nr:hypothetical protein [Frankiaceae bacterium]